MLEGCTFCYVKKCWSQNRTVLSDCTCGTVCGKWLLYVHVHAYSHWSVIHDLEHFMVCRYRYINVHVYLQMGILITTLYPPC